MPKVQQAILGLLVFAALWVFWTAIAPLTPILVVIAAVGAGAWFGFQEWVFPLMGRILWVARRARARSRRDFGLPEHEQDAAAE